jgi:hypothetical protein
MSEKAHLGWDFSLSTYSTPVKSDVILEEHESYCDEIIISTAVRKESGKMQYGYIPFNHEGPVEDSKFMYRHWVALAVYLAQRKDLETAIRERCMDIVDQNRDLLSDISYDFGKIEVENELL